jgi:hypothetical protein
MNAALPESANGNDHRNAGAMSDKAATNFRQDVVLDMALGLKKRTLTKMEDAI